MSFGAHVIPDLFDPAIRADQNRAAHDAKKRFPEKFLHPPRPVSLDGSKFRIAQQWKIQFVLGLEIRLRLYGICAHSQDGDILLRKLLYRVAKLGRFDRSTRCIRFRKEIHQHAPPAIIRQRNFLALIRLQPEIRRLISHLQHFPILPQLSFRGVPPENRGYEALFSIGRSLPDESFFDVRNSGRPPISRLQISPASQPRG